MRVSYLPTRIACLQPSATVILDAIGELDRLVACTRYCLDVVPELRDRSPRILADSWTANSTQIVEAKPDLVIASVPYQQSAVAEILKAGVRFLGLAPRTLSDIYSDIATISGALGVTKRGEALIHEMQSYVDVVRDRAKHHSTPRVFCEEWGKPIIASQPWVAELVEAAGGTFVGEPGRSITGDEILQLDPEIIVAAWCGAGERVPLEKIISARGWQPTRAASSSRVYCIRDEFLNTPAPTLLRGLDALAWAIHPELFPLTEGIRRITAEAASATDFECL
jgi:iron complex transport system substrate-binding protein